MQNYSFTLSSIIDTLENKIVENKKKDEALEGTLNHLVDVSIK